MYPQVPTTTLSLFKKVPHSPSSSSWSSSPLSPSSAHSHSQLTKTTPSAPFKRPLLVVSLAPPGQTAFGSASCLGRSKPPARHNYAAQLQGHTLRDAESPKSSPGPKVSVNKLRTTSSTAPPSSLESPTPAAPPQPTPPASASFNKTAAFSLIELMIVVAIIAILSSFAVPAYQVYTIRTRVAGALTLLGPIKADIINNASNGLPFASNVNLTPPNSPKSKVDSITIDPTYGLITITFSPSLTPDNVAYTLTLLPKQGDYTQPTLLQGTPTSSTIPDGSRIHWSCRSIEAFLKYGGWQSLSGTLPGQYAPPACNVI